MASLASRWHRGGSTVEVILEEGSSDDDDDFMEQEARLLQEAEFEPEQQSTASRPKFCEGEEQSPDAYGEAMAILAGLDREFAFNNPAAPATTVAPKPHVDVPIPIFVDNEAESYNQKKPAVTIQELNDDQQFDVDTKKSKYAVRTSSDNQFEMDENNCTNENIDHNNATNSTTIYSDDIPITACGRPDPSDDMVLPALAKNNTEDERFISPSDSALDNGQLFPCPSCGRTFLQKALERHAKVCQKASTKKRNVFDLVKKRLVGLDPVPKSKDPPKKKILKPEDEFQQCQTCQRKFGDKAYDRHVKWCMEKARRLQTSPPKDIEAVARQQKRLTYRPKTPSRKDSGGSGGSPSRKISNTSVESYDSPDLMTRSLSRCSNSSRKNEGSVDGRKKISYSGTKSLGRSSGISFLKDLEHTVETPDTHFVRNTTGRGSINRGPAPTRSSVLRQQKIDAAKSAEARSRTPNQGCPLHNPGAPMTPTLRRRAPSPSGSLYGSLPHKSSMRNQPSPASSLYGTLPHKRDSIGSNQSNDYSFKALVKPSVVRPSRSSYGLRREPEGIEHESTPKSSRPSSALQGGLYDHSQEYDHKRSQEYDPYQSAARQMQELLFGTSSGTAKNSGSGGSGDDPSANLRPSTNSAFQKYIPAANIPTTADIMSKLSSSNSSSGSRRTSWERETGNNKVNKTSESNGGSGSNWSGSSGNKPGYGESHGRMASKVAKFCHVCGNEFPVVDIRFCCECGVKRLGL